MTKRRYFSHVDIETNEPKTAFETENVRSRRGISHKTRPQAAQYQAPTTLSEAESDSSDRPRKSARRTLSHISVCGPAFPRSQYEKYDQHDQWQPPAASANERDAISEIKVVYDEQYAAIQNPEYVFFRLDDFTVYRPEHKTHAYQMCSLDRLNNRGGCDEFLFDGILSVGTEQRLLRGVPFRIVTIEGYGDPEVTDLVGRICIQSRAAAAEDVWYQLGTPSKEYARFFEPFLWLAMFTKYFLDYLLEIENVKLQDFRRTFYGWLYTRYSGHQTFRTWLNQCQLRDFRTTVAAHVGFLWKECYSIDSKETGLLKHQIWKEVDPFKLTAIPRQPQREELTVVTPFVYDCFKHLYFAGHLTSRCISDSATLDAVAKRKDGLGLTPLRVDIDYGLLTPKSTQKVSPTPGSSEIAAGDVVCIQPDTKTSWKSTSSTWYAYVQSIYRVKDTTKLDVIWLYEPSDTTLGAAYYPFKNELFMSDNCSCGRDAIDASSVIAKADVCFFARDPTQHDGLFVRQTFRTIHDDDTYDFLSLKTTDFRCACEQNHIPIFVECRSKFSIGATVLFREYNTALKEDRLEPGQIIDFLLEKQRVVLRRLRRRNDDNSAAKSNELIVTNETVEKDASKIIRHCQIRIFHPELVQEGLPTPYDQNGSGDFFFIVEKNSPTLGDQSNDPPGPVVLPPLEEGWDPEAAPPTKKLRGMGIFCGGGNFDRGIEDAGAVEFEYAIDYAEHALHTYSANAKKPDCIKLFLGSVDDYLAQAMAGSSKTIIARIGNVQVLVAGSPCPGFSRANIKKLDTAALRNSSMVASVVSYVDFYSPQYCMLENVVPMTQGMGPNRDENVFAQILAAFVAMGYQVQQFLMDAWSFGSSQSRSRVFIVASAPGLTPLSVPPHTHAHPQLQRQIKLGTSSNGKPFGVRREDYTPFTHVTPLRATKDLPDIGDSLTQLCPRYPDHRTPSEESNLARSCIAVVPNHPRGMGFVETIHSVRNFREEQQAWCSRITGLPYDFYETKLKPNKTRDRNTSKVYARVYPDKLFPTFLTCLRTNDSFNGRSLHWDQPRTLTIMEAKRGQGFLDHEVIIGSLGQQMKIIGNSVDRKVSLALGSCLRNSWLMNAPSETPAVVAKDSGDFGENHAQGYTLELPERIH